MLTGLRPSGAVRVDRTRGPGRMLAQHAVRSAGAAVLGLLLAPGAHATLVTADYLGAEYEIVSGEYTTSMQLEMSFTFDDSALDDQYLAVEEILFWDLFDGLLGCDSSRSDCLLGGSALWFYSDDDLIFGDYAWTATDDAGSSWFDTQSPGLYTRIATAFGTADVRFDDSGEWHVRVAEPGTPALLLAALLGLLGARRMATRGAPRCVPCSTLR